MAIVTGIKAKSQGAYIALRKAQRARELMQVFHYYENKENEKRND